MQRAGVASTHHPAHLTAGKLAGYRAGEWYPVCRLHRMLPRCVVIVSLFCLTGCQSQQGPPAGRAPAVASAGSAEREYEAVTASALVFDPPVSADQPALELGRAEREPRVAVGYDGPIIETYSVRMDDS